jgi:hypothetical protein
MFLRTRTQVFEVNWLLYRNARVQKIGCQVMACQSTYCLTTDVMLLHLKRQRRVLIQSVTHRMLVYRSELSVRSLI